jgi:membrane protein implicated in regulation of membrane protease activity
MDGLLPWLETLTFWHWMVLGVILVVLEILLPGIWFLWLGLGALTTGLIVLIISDLSWQVQSVVFCALSVISVIVGRLIMRSRTPEDHPTLNKRAAQYIGKVYILEDSTQRGHGRVRIGDSIWHVQLVDPATELAAGDKVTVTGVDGATLQVEPAS